MDKLRNIAIIAHVDHGKTTLVDEMLHAAQLFDEHEQPGELIMDHNDLERERGITIVSKNAAVRYGDFKINIIDTPGHADFGGEVERVLNMADGVLLLVDAFEGPMPQTRFVLQKALSLGLKPIVVINKVDKDHCRPEQVMEEIFDLMFELDATEEQLDFPVAYGSAKYGWMGPDPDRPTGDITYLMEQIIEHIPPPETGEGGVQMLITSLDYSSYVGRIAIGRLHSGRLKQGMKVSLVKRQGGVERSVIKKLYVYDGLEQAETEEVQAGEICAVVGLEGFDIGDTISDAENPKSLGTIRIDEPTMSMTFTINDSPFFGREGSYVTSRHIKERLDKELEKNLALRVEPGKTADSWKVYGRGVLHLAILIETMRREGYELQIGQPRVITKEIDGVKHEPVESLVIDLPEKYSGRAIDEVNQRRGQMTKMEASGDRVQLEFHIPSRGLIGLRSYLVTVTGGEAIMNHRFEDFKPYRGDIPERTSGSLISMETGTSVAYAIDQLQDRGKFFIGPNEDVYEGQIVGENNKPQDLTVNVTKSKKLTNIRAAGSDDKINLKPPVRFSLEEALEYIQADEYVEVTPESIRLRKIHLKEKERKRAKK